MCRDVRLSVALASLVGAGCSLSLEVPEPFANTCAVDEDCGSNASCDVERGLCVSVDAEPLQLGVVVYGEGASEGVAFPALEVDGARVHDFELPSSILAAGRVSRRDSDASVPVQLRFVRQSAFEGGDAHEITVSTSGEPQELSVGVEVDYQVRLPGGELYDVRVEPTGDASRTYPPLVLSSVRAPEEGDLWKLDVDFPETFPVLEGSVISILDDQEVPEDGLQVRAVDARGRTVSSTAVTGRDTTDEAEPGSFRIWLQPDAETFLLRISGGDMRPLFPTITVDPDLVHPGAIVVPRLEPVRYEALVEGSTATGRQAVSDAVVTLESHDIFGDLPDVRGTFRTTVSTDAQGRFAADVVPGTYDVIVTPAGQEELAVTAQEVRVEGGMEVIRGQLFTVPLRAQLGGTLETFDARPVVGASVRATALRRALDDDDVVGHFSRSTDVTTDATGRFTARVDRGVYDVAIRPPSGSGFPWVVSPQRIFDRDGEEVTEHFVVPAPVPMRGVVYGWDGSPMPDAELKAFALIEASDEEVRAVEVGRALADADGHYQLLLPPHL